MANTQHDVIVIGAGVNGLACARQLAAAGQRILVLERRNVTGGRFAVEEFHTGFRCRPVMEAIGPEAPLFVPLPDGRGMLLSSDPRLAAKAITQFSAKDAAKYPEYCATMSKIARALAPLLRTVPPDIDKPATGELWGLLKVGRGIRGLGQKDMFRLLRWGPMAAADFVAEWFEFEPLRAALAARGIYGTALGPWSAGSALLMLLQAAAAQLPAHLEKGNAEVRAGCEVTSIQVKDGRATGVVLRGGEEIAAKAVVSGADPKRTLLGMVDASHLTPDFLAKLRNYRCAGTVARVHLALDALPNFTALKGLSADTMGSAVQAWKDAGFEKAAPVAIEQMPLSGRIHIGPEIDYLERAFDASKYGEFSQKPFLEVTTPTLRDPSLAPKGKHVMSIHVQYAPYKLRAGDWSSRSDELAGVVVKTLAEYAPDLPGRILHRHVITPLDLEETYGLSGGHLFHGELALDQLFTMRPVLGWARYRTPVHGLYLCGAGTHPGIGTNGECGHNAAREIRKDLRR